MGDEERREAERLAREQAEGAVGGRDIAEQLAGILDRLTVAGERRDARLDAVFAGGRVRAINCRSYKMGEDWSHYVSYFRENVRASYQYQPTDARLNGACCTWIGSKLEAGPTNTAYQNLPATTKNDWALLDRELSKLYCNEEEKQNFLANPGGFKKGSQTLMEYKNELVRLVGLYQPELAGVPTEYQRQLVDRFIGGMDNPDLKKKLRFYCKRDRLNINDAYEFAVDYESTEVEEKVKEVAAAVRPSSVFAVAAAPLSGPSVNPAPIRVLERSVDPKVKAIELGLEQVRAEQAQARDNLDIFQRKVEEKFSGLGTRFDRLETLITNQQQSRPRLMLTPFPRPPQGQGMGRGGYRGPRPVAPSLTGGAGFVNNRIPGNFQPRPPGPDPRGGLSALAPMSNTQAPTADTNANPANPMPNPQTTASTPTQQGQPQLAAGGATATPAAFPHPMTDRNQSAYSYNDQWGEYLDYEAHPEGYTQQYQGTYSYYYPGDFQ